MSHEDRKSELFEVDSSGIVLIAHLHDVVDALSVYALQALIVK